MGVIGFLLKNVYLSKMKKSYTGQGSSSHPDMIGYYHNILKHAKNDQKAKSRAAYILFSHSNLPEKDLESALQEEGALLALDWRNHSDEVYDADLIYSKLPFSLRTLEVTKKAIETSQEFYRYGTYLLPAIPGALLSNQEIISLMICHNWTNYDLVPKDAMNEDNLKHMFAIAKDHNYFGPGHIDAILSAIPEMLVSSDSVNRFIALKIPVESLVKNRRKVGKYLHAEEGLLIADYSDAENLIGLYHFFKKDLHALDSRLEDGIITNFANKLKKFAYIPEHYVVDVPYSPAGSTGGYDGGANGPWEEATPYPETPEEGHTEPAAYRTEDAKALLKRFPKNVQTRIIKSIPRKELVEMGLGNKGN